MVYSHALVTYRKAMLRPHVKLVSFLLMPLVCLLIPPATFLRCLLFYLRLVVLAWGLHCDQS